MYLNFCLLLQVKKAQADEFTPGRGLPQCCVLASWGGEATSVGVLDQKLNFSGTQTLKSYWLHRGERYCKA